MVLPSSRGARVGIIGAGAAGLTTAHALRRAGYRHVEVLEKDDRVGGKCCTIYHEGRSFELGGALLTPPYHTVLSLLREVGMKTAPGSTGHFVDTETGRRGRLIPPGNRRWLDVGLECVKLGAEYVSHRRLFPPGFEGLPRELSMPFAQWAREKGLGETSELLRRWFTGFGSGYFDHIPAAYVLKYFTISGTRFYEILDGGYQGLWEKVARDLDVHRGVSIRRVVRAGREVVVESDHKCWRFDALVLACPLDAALGFLD